MPFDKHTCPIISFIVNGNKEDVILEYSDQDAKEPLKEDTERSKRFLDPGTSFYVDFNAKGAVDVYPSVRL